MIKVAGEDGIVVEVLEQAVHVIEQLGCIQPRPPGLFREFIVLEGADDGYGHVEGIAILCVVVFQVLRPHQRSDVVVVGQRPDVADVQMARNVVEIHVPGSLTKADGQEHRLGERDGQTLGQLCRGLTIFGPEFISEFGIVGILG